MLAAQESRAVHAHRDAVRAARQALELWPDGDDEERRVAALEAHAHSAELAGELGEAAAAWRELSAARTGAPLAAAQRSLAAVCELLGDRDAAATARRAAAEAYAAAGCPAEAAIERLALGDYLRNTSQHSSRHRARAGRGPRSGGRRAARPACPRARARGLVDRARRRARGRAGEGPGRPGARTRAQPDRGRGRALPAAEHGPVRRGRLPARAGDARHRARHLPDRRSCVHRAGVRHVHGLRAARVRRLAAGRGGRGRADRRGPRRVGVRRA